MTDKYPNLTEEERISIYCQSMNAIVFDILVRRLENGYPRPGFIGRIARFFKLKLGWVGAGLTGSEYRHLKKLYKILKRETVSE